MRIRASAPYALRSRAYAVPAGIYGTFPVSPAPGAGRSHGWSPATRIDRGVFVAAKARRRPKPADAYAGPERKGD